MIEVFKNKLYQKKYRNKIIVFLHLLKKAEHTENKEYLGGVPIICKPGQIVTTRVNLAKETNINEKTLEHALMILEKKDKLIKQQKTNKNRLITIAEYKSKGLNEQQTEINTQNRDSKIVNFINKCSGMATSDDNWYKALLDLKTSIITEYINKHIIFEGERKKKLRYIKEKNLNDEFYNIVLPFIESVSESNKERLTKDKYNNNRNVKNKTKRYESSGNTNTKKKDSSILQVE